MSRPLTRSESVDRKESAWYTVDKRFLLVVRYHPGGFAIELTYEGFRLDAMTHRSVGVTHQDTRIEDVLLPSWKDELFIHLTFQPFGSSKIHHYIQRLLIPISKRIVHVMDATHVVKLRHAQAWLAHMVCHAPSKDYILPFMDEDGATVLLASNLYDEPAHYFVEDAVITDCGFWKDDRWWLAAVIQTPKGPIAVAHAEKCGRFFLPVSWPISSRVRVLETGVIQANREVHGDRWTTVGSF